MPSNLDTNVNLAFLNKGDTTEAEITKITNFGAFARLPNKKSGLIHISQISDTYIKDINQHLKVGDKVNARVLEIASDGKIQLTLKKEKENISSYPKRVVFPIPFKERTYPKRMDLPNPLTLKGRPSRPLGKGLKEGSYPKGKIFKNLPFEDKMKKFLKQS